MITWKNDVRPIDKLVPYQFNPRKIPDAQIEKLKESIEASGYNAPILIDTDNTIIAGHQRWHVLKLLGYTQVDVRIPSKKLTKKQFQRINIQDNVTFGEWDFDILTNNFEHADLVDWGVDVPNIDFKPVDENSNDRLDEKTLTECPECGHEF